MKYWAVNMQLQCQEKKIISASTNVMKKMQKESEVRREKFLSDLLAEQLEVKKAEREKERDLCVSFLIVYRVTYVIL